MWLNSLYSPNEDRDAYAQSDQSSVFSGHPVGKQASIQSAFRQTAKTDHSQAIVRADLCLHWALL